MLNSLENITASTPPFCSACKSFRAQPITSCRPASCVVLRVPGQRAQVAHGDDRLSLTPKDFFQPVFHFSSFISFP